MNYQNLVSVLSASANNTDLGFDNSSSNNYSLDAVWSGRTALLKNLEMESPTEAEVEVCSLL